MKIRMICLHFFVIFTWSSISAENLENSSKSHRLLNSQHLIVAGALQLTQYRVVRNASGHILNVTGIGPEMLSWLSQSYNFTYSYLQINETPIDSIDGVRGLVSYVDRRECDMLISVSFTPSRLAFLDFTHPFSYLPINYLILRPEAPVNTWIVLCLTIFGVPFVLKFFNWYVTTNRLYGHPGEKLLDPTMHVISILFYQAKTCSSKNLMIRIIIISWCIASFALTNFYSALLISFVTSPTLTPLINSIYDVPNRPDVRVAVNRGINLEAVILGSNNGILKQLGDKLRNYPVGRCNLTSQCVDLMKSGGYVYVASSASYLPDAMKAAFSEKKKCTMQMGKESFLNLPIPFAMRKADLRMAELNIGITRMREAGLLQYWEKYFQVNVVQCLKKQDTPYNPLTLKSLTGAFVILITGFFFSFSVFAWKAILYKCNT